MSCDIHPVVTCARRGRRSGDYFMGEGTNMIRTVMAVALLALVAGTPVVRAGDKALSTEQFVAKVVDCNVCEKDLAEKAVKSADSADVRKYAQRLVDDHTKLNVRVGALARDLKIGVVTGLSKDHKEALLKLTTAKGKDFDRAFVRHMVKGHEEAIKMFEAQAKNATNNEVKTFATEALPTLREHLEMARKLDTQINK
jgi:putative membrane protein